MNSFTNSSKGFTRSSSRYFSWNFFKVFFQGCFPLEFNTNFFSKISSGIFLEISPRTSSELCLHTLHTLYTQYFKGFFVISSGICQQFFLFLISKDFCGNSSRGSFKNSYEDSFWNCCCDSVINFSWESFKDVSRKSFKYSSRDCFGSSSS